MFDSRDQYLNKAIRSICALILKQNLHNFLRLKVTSRAVEINTNKWLVVYLLNHIQYSLSLMTHFHRDKKCYKKIVTLNYQFLLLKWTSGGLYLYIKKIGKALIIITELQEIQFEETFFERIENKISTTSMVWKYVDHVLSFFVQNLISFYDNLADLDCSTANISFQTALEEAHQDILKLKFKIFCLYKAPESCSLSISTLTFYGSQNQSSCKNVTNE